jgi:hypothetical protein
VYPPKTRPCSLPVTRYMCASPSPGAYVTHRERDLLVITDHVVLGNRPPPDANRYPRMQPPLSGMRDLRRSPWGATAARHRSPVCPVKCADGSETEGWVAPVELDDHVGASDRPKLQTGG